jgi:hypothetical protein
VRFRQHELFPPALLRYNETDTVDVEVYQCWLQEPGASDQGPAPKRPRREETVLVPPPAARLQLVSTHSHAGDSTDAHAHAHAHTHTHEGGACGPHETRAEVEQAAVEREGPARPGQAYGEALLRLLRRRAPCPGPEPSTEQLRVGRMRRVQLVRRDGRDVSTLYGREGGGSSGAAARGAWWPPTLGGEKCIMRGQPRVARADLREGRGVSD